MEPIIQIRKDLLIDRSELQLVEQVGEGSYGQVWRGTMGSIPVAVKKLVLARTSPQVLRSVEKEIDTLASLHHPHVLQIYGVCVFTSTEFWIVMEFADGGSLYSLLSDESMDIPLEIRCTWIREIAASVAFLHKRGIIHRDIKSPNFLVVKDSIKICDFGMATTTSITSTASSIKSAGGVGTVRWLAPECTSRIPIFDAKTDVYSVGMVIWEVMARSIPFAEVQQDAQVVCLVKYEKERPPIPSDCPEGIAEVIQQCWHHDPASRPSGDDVVKKLNHVLSLLQSTEQPVESEVQLTTNNSTEIVNSTPPISSPPISSPPISSPPISSPPISSPPISSPPPKETSLGQDPPTSFNAHDPRVDPYFKYFGM